MMMKYGLDRIEELKFTGFAHQMERRDNQWVDVVLHPILDETTPLPDDLIQFTIYVITTLEGTIVGMVPQDEDCDCEYQLTFSEKEQVRAYMNQPSILAEILRLAPPN